MDSDKVSAAMGAYMLQGWTMLNDGCPDCNTPLMRNRESTSQICASCELFPPADPDQVPKQPAMSTPAPTQALPSLPSLPSPPSIPGPHSLRPASPANPRISVVDPMEARKALRPAGSRVLGGAPAPRPPPPPRSSTPLPMPPTTPTPIPGSKVLSGPLAPKPSIPLPPGPPPPPPSTTLSPKVIPRDMRRSPQSSIVISGSILPPSTPLPPPPSTAPTSAPEPVSIVADVETREEPEEPASVEAPVDNSAEPAGSKDEARTMADVVPASDSTKDSDPAVPTEFAEIKNQQSEVDQKGDKDQDKEQTMEEELKQVQEQVQERVVEQQEQKEEEKVQDEDKKDQTHTQEREKAHVEHIERQVKEEEDDEEQDHQQEHQHLQEPREYEELEKVDFLQVQDREPMEEDEDDKALESDDDFEDAEEEVFKPSEEEVKMREVKREQSDRASRLIGQKMLQGWAMLQDPCPNIACHGVPLLRSRDKKEYCVVCENYFQREQDLEQGKYTIVPVASQSAMETLPTPAPSAVDPQSTPVVDEAVSTVALASVPLPPAPQGMSPARPPQLVMSPPIRATTPVSSPSMGRSHRDLQGRVSSSIILPPTGPMPPNQPILGKHTSEDLEALREDDEGRKHFQIIRKVGEFAQKSLPPVPGMPQHGGSRPTSVYSNSSGYHPSDEKHTFLSHSRTPPAPTAGVQTDTQINAPAPPPLSPEVQALVAATHKTIATILVKLEAYRHALEVSESPKECQALTSQIKGLMECLKACRETL